MTKYEARALAVRTAYLLRDGHCPYTLAQLIDDAQYAEKLIDASEAAENLRTGT